MAPSLVKRYEGPFKFLENIGNNTYRLELSFHMRYIYPVCHISQLKSCQRDLDDPSQFEPSIASSMVVDPFILGNMGELERLENAINTPRESSDN
jgi:hypothetical protein